MKPKNVWAGQPVNLENKTLQQHSKQMKAPLPLIKSRSAETHVVMEAILAVWSAPGFMSPSNFGGSTR